MAAPTHECPGGCGAQVDRSMLACKPDWFRLPKPYRDAVNRSWSHHRTEPAEHRRALTAALAWYRDNPPDGA